MRPPCDRQETRRATDDGHLDGGAHGGEAVDVGVHGQLALDELAAVDVLLEEPVEAVQFDAVSVELEVVDLAADDFDAAVVEVPDVPEVVAVVAVVPGGHAGAEHRGGQEARSAGGDARTGGGPLAAGPVRDGVLVGFRSWDPSSGSAVKARPSSCKSRARTSTGWSYVPLTGGIYSARPWNEPRPRPRRVLLAEDDRSVRDALVMALELEGYEVHATNDGEQALAAFDPFRPTSSSST